MTTIKISTFEWDQALLSASEIPMEMVLDGFFKSKLQELVQLQTVSALYDQESVRNNCQTSYSRLKTSVILHNDVRKETRVVSVKTDWPLETVAVVRDEKDDPLPNPILKTKTECEKGVKEENSDNRSQILCRSI